MKNKTTHSQLHVLACKLAQQLATSGMTFDLPFLTLSIHQKLYTTYNTLLRTSVNFSPPLIPRSLTCTRPSGCRRAWLVSGPHWRCSSQSRTWRSQSFRRSWRSRSPVCCLPRPVSGAASSSGCPSLRRDGRACPDYRAKPHKITASEKLVLPWLRGAGWAAHAHTTKRNLITSPIHDVIAEALL